MRRTALGPGSDDVAQLGEPTRVFRASRKTLFWGFFLAFLPCAIGVGVILVVLGTLMEDWSEDVPGSIVFLVLAGLSLWGGMALWKRGNRLRRLQVVVHVGGLAYRDDRTCFRCRWGQIEAVRAREMLHYEEPSLGVGGPVLTHVSHHYTLRRDDGVELVFTDEIRNVAELDRIIQQELALHGTLNDEEVAALLGRTKVAVRHMRARRGIANWHDGGRSASD